MDCCELKLPPSAKLVLSTLKDSGPLTQKGLIEKTGLSPRTVKNAIKILRQCELIKEIPNFKDLRIKIYAFSNKSPCENRAEQRVLLINRQRGISPISR
ncbi:MAG: ArsR family transcriptional regulator [Candidatus Methanomethylicota archaeon]|uniref:ArsR family transcriptional regulator n=1 Tax=Thermoproteota archaeon TaxID=2056631 RepID=A0A497F0E8_9CREN|nr:MAG: ArsR family transcriptional regulator [Candidatus Verstraetearchaeota archaeon]RLE52378.1 MAG: ArsR family transcriptional regulator [Candidatus Verstraetearchaeota archaeon]